MLQKTQWHKEKRELTEKLDEATEELNSVGQTYIVGAKMKR